MILTVGDEPAHAQCVNALERCVLPTASHPDLIRLQEGVRVALSDKVDRRQISASAGERRITEAGRLVAVPEREWGTGNNAAAARSRRSKKCCAELVAVAGATDAEAG
jgi:hypothetical protein